MTPRPKVFVTALACGAALLGVAGALAWRLHIPPQIQLATGTFLSPQRALPDFSLIDQRGQAFDRGSLDGHWSFMFFGFTNCPDVCPTTLATLAAMEKRLRDAGAPILPRVVFVSVDAKRDTPEQLAKYVPYFDSAFTGVTAPDQRTIESLARKLGVAVAIRPGAAGASAPGADRESYTVDHSAEIFVIDPRGKLAAVLTGPFTADGLSADFQRIVSVDG
jgi:protein SCO1